MLQKDYLLKEDRFRIVRQTSQNLHGMTYEAFDNVLKSTVTLKEICAKRNKFLTTAQIEAQKTFVDAEARILTALKHDSILRVYDYFSEADRHYLVTEFTDGKNLSELLRNGAGVFSIPNVLKWADELLNAISYLHSQTDSLVHGNIKPANIILTSDGKIKLLPFGISRMANVKKDSLITEQEFDAANLHYSPLEQIWTGLDPASRKAILNNYEEKSARILEKPLDAQTDIYALGATLYHLFTKCLPIDPLERSIDILEGKNDPLAASAKLNPSIPVEISDALLKAMQIKRENRFDSALSMQKILKNVSAKMQVQEVSKSPKYKDDEDLLEIISVEPKVKKPQNLTADLQNTASEAEQKRQFELIKKQLQEAEAQRLKAEQRAVEAEKLLLEKATKSKPQLSEITDQPTTIELTAASAKTEISEIAREIENDLTKPEIRETYPTKPDFNQKSSDNDQMLFAEPPKDNQMFRRMAVGAVALALIGAAGWGAFNFSKSNAVAPSQSISAGESPKSEPEKDAAATQTSLPANVAEISNSTVDPTDIQQTSAKTVVPETAESESPEETPTNYQSARSKSAAPVSQRPPKQTPATPKIAAANKKTVTVDDIINDN